MSRSQNTALVFVAVALLFLFWKNSAADSYSLTGPPASASVMGSNLEVSIRNAGEHKLALGVTNKGDKPPDRDLLELPAGPDRTQARTRRMPPESDSLVTIKPGEKKDNVLEGTWMGVWDADGFKTEELESIGSAQEAQFGDFKAELESVEF
ncbi:hypothetical protein PG997_001494 [Apiospora hydei]|uniref:Secreted protein n=1 Tax=Apiospora hydei TaxID=1337664 RepID=A0ABR1XDQ0_9PEZI